MHDIVAKSIKQSFTEANDEFWVSVDGEGQSALSPDGAWIAYSSDETGEWEVYVRPFPNIDDGKWQISTNGGEEPLWGPEGRELFFLSELDDGNLKVVRVDVTTVPVFSAGTPQVLFEGDYVFGGSPNWDISPDGRRFLLMKAASLAAPGDEPTSIAFVDNWFEELKRLTPQDAP